MVVCDRVATPSQLMLVSLLLVKRSSHNISVRRADGKDAYSIRVPGWSPEPPSVIIGAQRHCAQPDELALSAPAVFHNRDWTWPLSEMFEPDRDTAWKEAQLREYCWPAAVALSNHIVEVEEQHGSHHYGSSWDGYKQFSALQRLTGKRPEPNASDDVFLRACVALAGVVKATLDMASRHCAERTRFIRQCQEADYPDGLGRCTFLGGRVKRISLIKPKFFPEDWDEITRDAGLVGFTYDENFEDVPGRGLDYDLVIKVRAGSGARLYLSGERLPFKQVASEGSHVYTLMKDTPEKSAFFRDKIEVVYV